MRNTYKMRAIKREFFVESEFAGVKCKLKREELECGHIRRANNEPRSTAEAIGLAAHALAGTTPKRRCFECGGQK